jgi:hypothetical protein
MTPEQATQWLDNRAAEFAARRAAPVPSREQVEDAHTAEVRLAALLADPNFARRYSEGGAAERREIAELQEIVSQGADETGMSVVVGDAEVIDAVSDPHGIRRSDLFGALSDLNQVGIPLAGIEKFLDGNFSAEDQMWAQRELDRAMATPEWTAALLRGDPTAKHAFTAWCAVISAGKTL